MRLNIDNNKKTQKIILKIIRSIGSISSLIIHTMLFMTAFILYFFGVDLNAILLVLTTVVSLEAIYLSILIQMSVNFQFDKLDTIQENVEDIQENVEDIQESVEDIQVDVDEINNDEDDEDDEDILEIKETINRLLLEVEKLTKRQRR